MPSELASSVVPLLVAQASTGGRAALAVNEIFQVSAARCAPFEDRR